MTSRRDLLKLFGASSLMGPGFLQALETRTTAKLFQEQLAQKPWLLGFKSVDRDYYEATASITGRIPDGLRGMLYRNGPGQHEIGSFRYEHWFDGDGLIQGFDINPAGVKHKARVSSTAKRKLERQAGKPLYPAFGTVVPNARPPKNADEVNTANISVLNHHGRLFTLWEAGSAHEVDPDTLETKGLHSFSPESSGLPFSAHPRIDQDGHLWNFGYSTATRKLVLWHMDSAGTVKKLSAIDCDPISMPHDFIVTRRHIVILVPPMHFEDTDREVSFLDQHHWQPDRPTRVLVVSKDNFDDHYWLELPAQWVFHFGNGWEDETGVIRFDGSSSPDPSSMTDEFRHVMHGGSTKSSFGQHYGYRIDTRTRRISADAIFAQDIETEFPTIDPRLSCVQNNQLICVTRGRHSVSAHELLNSVSVVNLKTESMKTFTYPESQIPEEHLFIPAPGSTPETNGWLVGTSLDYAMHKTHLNIFNAQSIENGPVAVATLPYAMPLGFHGKFVAKP